LDYQDLTLIFRLIKILFKHPLILTQILSDTTIYECKLSLLKDQPKKYIVRQN